MGEDFQRKAEGIADIAGQVREHSNIILPRLVKNEYSQSAVFVKDFTKDV